MSETIHTSEESKNPLWRKSLRFIVILGIIVLLFFISIGIVRFVPKLFSGAGTFLSSIFGGKSLETTIDKKEVKSGDAFYVTWKNNTKDNEGAYTFTFKCTDGVKIEYQSTTGSKPVICNTYFPLPHEINSYPFSASSTKAGSVSVPYTINLWDTTTGKSKLSASSNIVIIPKNAAYSDAGGNSSQSAAVNLYPSSNSTSDSDNNPYSDATTTPTYPLGGFDNSTSNSNSSKNTSGNKTSNTTSGSSYTSTRTYGSSPNLGISLVQVGYVDNNANYYNTTSIPENSRVLVRFKVFNTGDAPTGSWTLSANLPTKIYNERTFTSGSQPSILPGNSYEMTLAFDSFDPSISTISLSVTSSGNDVGSSNNYLSIPVTNGGYNNGGWNGGGYYNNGNADLVVTIKDVGIVDRYNNNFYYSNSINTNDKAGVKFEVQNIGGTASGIWYFKADLPTSGNSTTYTSGAQNSLAPGQTATFTLGFDNPRTGYFQINVDSGNNVYEQNEGNNTQSRNIYVNSY